MRFIPLLLCCTSIWSLPRDPVVMKGNASFTEQEEGLSICAENASVIHWGDFSIGENQWARFDLPTESAAVLNRVVTATPSLILGKLSSNGQILLINPNGILVGKEGLVQTESFIASTLDLQNAFFDQNEKWVFEGTSEAEIIHQGQISVAKDLLLIGTVIHADGPISASGSCALVSAQSLTWQRNLIETGPWKERSHVGLSSMIKNPSGAVTLLGRTIFVDGNIDAESGMIALGGSEHFFPAEQTIVTAPSILSTNAADSGNGGSIYVWSDKSTVFAGLAESTGGKTSGDGGFIEVSGGWVNFAGRVDTRAPFGKTGHFLLDPLDIEIGAAADMNITLLPGPIYEPSSSPSAISQATLDAALNGSNVTVQSIGGPGLEAGNIYLINDYPINSGGSTNTLTLTAFNDIYINATLAYLGPNSGALVLNAPSGNIIVGNAPVAQTTNAIVRTDGNNVTMTARNIFVQGNAAGPYFAQVSAVNNGTAFVTATAGDVQVLAANGDGAYAQIGADTNPPGTFMNIQVSAAQNVVVTGSTATDSFAIIGHAQVPTIKPDTFAGDITVNAGGNVLVTGGAAVTNGTAIIGHLGATSNAFTVNTTGNIIVNAIGTIALQGGTNQSYARIGNGSLIYNNATVSGSIDVVAGGSLTMTGGNSGSMAHIGHQSVSLTGASVGSTTITAPHIHVQADSITMTPGLAGSTAIIGARANAGGAASTVTITDLTVTTTHNLVMNPSINSVALIGPVGGPLNGVDSAITVTVGGDLLIDNTNGSVGDAITNFGFNGGASNPAAPVIVTATNIVITTNAVAAAIVSSGPLTVQALQDIQMTGVSPSGTIVMTGVNGTNIDAGRDILITSQTVSATGTVGIGGGAFVPMNLSGRVHAGRDIILTDTSGAGTNFSAYISSTGTGILDVIAGRDLILSNQTIVSAVDQLNLVVDDQFPTPPFIGPGSFQLAAGATVSVTAPENLRIFTARQNQNVILGTLTSNAISTTFSPGTPYADIPPELWGVYFYDPFFYPGQVFTIFYKDTLQAIAQQATTVIDESLVDLHPYDEFPGWLASFYWEDEGKQERYMIRRRQLKLLNNPKTWTQLAF